MPKKEPSVLEAENEALRLILDRAAKQVEVMTERMREMGKRLRILEAHFNGEALRHVRERVARDKPPEVGA